MRILEYSCRGGSETDLAFSRVEFGKVNLLVGGTATGKTRLLNTLFNLGRFALGKQAFTGAWDVVFEHKGSDYRWVFETKKVGGEILIVRDNVSVLDETKGEILIVERDEAAFRFMSQEMPRLPPNQSSVALLKEEELMAPVYEGFSRIMRRTFSGDALQNAAGLQVVSPRFLNKMDADRDLETLFVSQLNASGNMFVLLKYFRSKYELVCNYYKSIFPFVDRIWIHDANELHDKLSFPGYAPVFTVREKGVEKWIEISQMSSGMQKVLLILIDLLLIPDGGVYLIDEYENSLGINAIEFLPTVLLDIEIDAQIFLTSHHPYIINNIPLKDWYVFHRRGAEVTIKHGSELIERFGKSKQQAFVQLINDPFYSEGVE